MKRFSKPHHSVSAVHHKKDLGQHFLYDIDLLRTLIAQIPVTGKDSVLEIGAGAGTLTRVLCENAARVISVEVDQALIPILHVLEDEYKNLTVVNSDIRKLDLNGLALGDSFIVVANIPYSITSQIFELFWGNAYPIRQMSVMVQKEVADKLIATPGNAAYGLMSVRCSYYCSAEVIAHVPASAFTPPPKVDSAFVKLTFRKEPIKPVDDEKLLWRIIQASYRLRRKTLLNALKTVVQLTSETMRDILDSLGLPHTVRGEVLDVEQWITLSNLIAINIHQDPEVTNC